MEGNCGVLVSTVIVEAFLDLIQHIFCANVSLNYRQDSLPRFERYPQVSRLYVELPLPLYSSSRVIPFELNVELPNRPSSYWRE